MEYSHSCPCCTAPHQVTMVRNHCLSEYSYPAAAIVMAGGWGAGSSVEVFSPATNTSCELPGLPQDRRHHSLDTTDTGLLLCGGIDPDTGHRYR